MGEWRIRAMTADDADAVLRIYAEGIATGHATFETDVPAWPAWDAKHRQDCRFVAATDGNGGDAVLGWAVLSAVSSRPVYSGVAEESIYVADDARGLGVGRGLLAHLIGASEAAGVWTLQAGIFPENEASIALHRAHGFEVIGTRRRIGRMAHGPLAGHWRDVVWMERRSSEVGQA